MKLCEILRSSILLVNESVVSQQPPNRQKDVADKNRPITIFGSHLLTFFTIPLDSGDSWFAGSKSNSMLYRKDKAKTVVHAATEELLHDLK